MTSVVKSFVDALLGNKSGNARAFKAVGSGIWVAAFTNNFQDRHQEILSAKAHERYVARVKLGLVPMPELWHWHKEATKYGEADFVDRLVSDNGAVTVVAIGHFDDTLAGRAGEATHMKAGADFELSHGFIAPRWAFRNKVYEDYVTFEISTLPRGKAANPFTTFEEVVAMAVTAEQKQSVTDLFGDAAPAIIAQLELSDQNAAKVKEMGVRFKEYADVLQEPDKRQKDADASLGGAEFIQSIMKAQNEQAVLVTTLGNAFVAWDTKRKTQETELTAEIAKVKVLREKLEADIGLVPKRVEDAIAKALDEDDEDAAEEELDKQKDGDPEYDPMFPGMKIKVAKPE